MLTKENIIETINSLEDPINFDDVIERIYLLEKIEKGLEQSRNNNVITDSELSQRINSWFV
jgi:hypothetical protein